MSDFLAIGGVSATLKGLLADRMEMPDGIDATKVAITIGPPAFSPRDNEPHKEDPRVNLFLYRVSENGYLQNQEIAGRESAGYGHPPLSLNLHYLLTAYGNKQEGSGSTLFDDTTAHHLLGSAMRVLHDIPIINDSLTTVRTPSGEQILDDSLRDSYERVRMSLEPLTLEDITKVWTALALRYRLSAAYAVNVVQIESRAPRSFPRPVGVPASPVVPPPATDQLTAGPHVRVVTIQSPTISHVWVKRAGETTEQRFPYARINDTLVLYGTSLSGPVTSIVFGDFEVAADESHPERVEVRIPANEALQPGVRTVKVITTDPATPGASFSSNEAAFVLVPTVDPATITLSAGPPRTLTLDGARLIAPTPGGETVIGRSVVTRTDYLTATPTTLTIPVPTTLPARGVPVLISGALPDPIPLGQGRKLTITIGTHNESVTATSLKSPLPRDQAARIIQGLIRDADPTAAAFSRAVARLSGDQLVITAGDLASVVRITSPAGNALAADLKLTAAQPPGAAVAAISGYLGATPVISSPTPSLRVRIGAAQPVDITLQNTKTLTELATDLQAKLNAAPTAPYKNAQVLVGDGRLIVIPGTATPVSFESVPADPTTVTELQLHGRFAVRVRVNGAESIDAATVELPQ
jgi:hypothetical protein